MLATLARPPGMAPSSSPPEQGPDLSWTARSVPASFSNRGREAVGLVQIRLAGGTAWCAPRDRGVKRVHDPRMHVEKLRDTARASLIPVNR